MFVAFVLVYLHIVNVSVQYDGGFFPDIILLTLCYYHWGTRLNAMKSFCLCSLCSHLLKICFDIFSPCLEGAQKVKVRSVFFSHLYVPILR